MKHDQCWMWTKRKYSASSNLGSPTNSSYDDSWEEQAFAEDAAGRLGGCIWPPRSYSCSFCRREFRSAQALGGHMNVHRRDRARLKQPPSPQNETLHSHHLATHHHNPVQNPFSSLGNYPYSSPVCGLAYNNSNPNSDLAVLASPPSPSPSKALAPSINENCKETLLVPPYNSSPLYSSKSWSNLAEDRLYSHNFDLKAENEKISKILDSGCRYKEENDETNVAMSLNLVVCQAHSPLKVEKNKEAAAAISCKRRRTDASSIPFFPKPISIHRDHIQSQMFEFSPSSIEELDLELRLGQRPKVL